MKQIYILLIALLMGLSANAEESGTCGPDLKWHLTDNGVLTISGNGEMNDYSYRNRSPWSKSDIKRIIIGDGVTTIGKYAFADCRVLTSVTIPNNVTTIGEYAFSVCSALTSVTIPNSVTKIGSGAFSNCSELTSVTIPNSVTTIGRAAFSGCFNITQISSKAVVPPTCGINALDDINKWNCKLFVPKANINAYKQAPQWKEFFFIESTTGITNTVYNKAGLVDVYTIDGAKRLSKASTDEINALPKGVYIVNGKKIIIK